MNDTATKSPDARSFLPTTETNVPVETKAPQPSVAAPIPTNRREGIQIKLVGEIDPNGPISLTTVKYFVLRHPEDTPKIIHLDSSGGSVDEAFRVYEFLRALPTPLATVADKSCRSAALIIFMSANFRVANPGAEFLLHGTHMGTDSLPPRLNARMLQRYADDMKAGDDRILDLLEARTGFDRSGFECEMKDERAMSEGFAISSGIVHELTGSNRCDPTWPEAVRQMQAAKMILPPSLTAPHYLAACREAAHFPVID